MKRLKAENERLGSKLTDLKTALNEKEAELGRAESRIRFLEKTLEKNGISFGGRRVVSRRPLLEEVIMTDYVVTTSKDGDKTIHADLIDGRFLLITKPCPRKMKELMKGAPDESYHHKHSDAELPEPTTGRFIAQDSYAGDRTDPMGLNLYVYGRDDPERYLDPTGDLVRLVSGETNTKGSRCTR